MDLSQIFGLAPSEPTAQTDPALPAQAQGGWSGVLSDPRARSALISAGLQMMTGGWGNGVQQLGSALGAGAQGYAGMDKMLYDRAQADKELAQKASEGAAQRAQSETNTRIAADSRNEVAQLRTEAMLERTRMNLSAKATPSEALKYRQEARKVYEGNILNMSKPQEAREAEIEDLASRMYDADRARGVGGGAATSTGGPSGAGPQGQGGTGPATQAPKATSTGEKGPTLDQLMADKTNGPRVQELLSTPEGQAELIKRNPNLKSQIDDYNRRKAQEQYLPHNLIRGLFGAPKTTP